MYYKIQEKNVQTNERNVKDKKRKIEEEEITKCKKYWNYNSQIKKL